MDLSKFNLSHKNIPDLHYMVFKPFNKYVETIRCKSDILFLFQIIKFER